MAIGGVVAFHYGLGLGGGFAGVDVFFVVSGYLITSLLKDADARPGFLAGFAERRVRRILPALLVVVGACALAAPAIMLPSDLQAVGLGLINAVVFDANHYFLSLALDYFNSGALGQDPMLHMWSLAVEGQFYLAFALIWVTGRRRPAARSVVIAIMAAASFTASAVGVVVRPDAAFYLFPSRFWEFMAGASLTLPGLPRLMRVEAAAALGAAGLALVSIGFLALTEQTPFPGAAALLPCTGAALVIWGGRMPNVVSRTLGARYLARLGRLSYALYLWHWPVLVYAGYGRAAPLPASERLALLALATLLAAATHRLVERPFIERRLLPRPRTFLLACAASTLATISAGLLVNLAGQNVLTLWRLPPAVTQLANGTYDTVNLRCPIGTMADPGCRFGAAEVQPTVAVWGNSFARMWMPAIDAAARRHGAAGLAMLIVRCPPLLGPAFSTIPGCARFNEAALAYLDAHPDLHTVVLGGDWNRFAADLPALRSTVDVLHGRGRRVVLILSPPAVPYPVPRTLALAALHHRPSPPLLAESEARTAPEREMAAGLTLEGTGTVTLVDPFPAFCHDRTCAVQADGRPLYYDDRHVTRFAAVRAETLFDPLFGPPPPR